MTRTGYVKRIGQLRDDRNRLEQKMIAGDLPRGAPEWTTADRRLVDTIKAALAAGVTAERIQVITWRESPLR